MNQEVFLKKTSCPEIIICVSINSDDLLFSRLNIRRVTQKECDFFSFFASLPSCRRIPIERQH